jgi:pimeloyl-ACP methyl ester carboxylesterase
MHISRPERPEPPVAHRNRAFRLLVQATSDETAKPAARTVVREGDDVDGLAAREQAGNDILRRLGLDSPPVIIVQKHGGTRAIRPVLLPQPGARRVTLVFSGNSRILTFPEPLLTENSTHVMLLKDTSRRFGLAGIPGLGGDYSETVANFHRIFAELGVDEVFCIGLSAGGSACMKYGCDLRAQGILGFSVPTTLNLDDDPGASLKDYPQLALLYRHNRALGIDLGAYYAGTSPRPRLMLVYSSGHKRDSWLALRMQGIGGVDLIEAEGYMGHLTYRHACDSGMLPALIDRLFTLRYFKAVG